MTSKMQMMLSAIAHRDNTRQAPIEESTLATFDAITAPALTPAQVAEILDGMLDGKLVTAFHDPDRQQRRFMITDAGREALSQMRANSDD